MQGSNLPDRINPDAILEALIEFRFDNVELPELVLGRLLDAALWAKYQQVRLPAADIPQPLREVDANLRYQPLVELRRDDGDRVAKIGSNVMSYHIIGSYPGWPTFKQEIEDVLKEVILKLKTPQFSRIGLRYINILRPDDHHIHGLMDTNITLKVGENELKDSLAVTYNRLFDETHVVTVKLATPNFVMGAVKPGFSLLRDIDVATNTGHIVSDYQSAVTWIENAHTYEKAEFFAILPERITKKLSDASGGA